MVFFFLTYYFQIWDVTYNFMGVFRIHDAFFFSSEYLGGSEQPL